MNRLKASFLFLRLRVQALTTLAFVRAALWILRYRDVQRLLKTARASGKQAVPIDHVIAAVKSAARYVPRASCLVVALAAQALLARFGFNSVLRVGLANSERGFVAHAWLIYESVVLIGGNLSEIERYTPLVDLPLPRRRA
jgi:hypothetical protein